jgi:2,4-dienoyl-CoA reductase (NADPH2)
MKICAQDFDDALAFLGMGPSGNTLAESVPVAQWLVDTGVDALHVSTGSFFPHPRNPAGVDLPVEDLAKSYDTMVSNGERTFANFLLFHGASGVLARNAWNRAAGPADEIEGKNLPDSRAIKAAVSVPVICTGGVPRPDLTRPPGPEDAWRSATLPPAGDDQYFHQLPPR